MKLVSYVPLVDEGSQAFVARRLSLIIDPASADSLPAPGFRPAIVLSTSESEGAQFANLAVFTDFGDAFRGATPDAVVRVARVPYSEGGEPGTYHAVSASRAAK